MVDVHVLRLTRSVDTLPLLGMSRFGPAQLEPLLSLQLAACHFESTVGTYRLQLRITQAHLLFGLLPAPKKISARSVAVSYNLAL